MNQTSLILLLVLLLECRGKLISDNPYGSNSFVNLPVNNQPKTYAVRRTAEPTEESTTVSSQNDRDPFDPSETTAYNKIQRSAENEDEESVSNEDPEGPPDHTIPYSEHEEPRNVSTKPNYPGPGVWAKPAKDSDVPLDFVPTKLYAQVRRTHTVRRLPRQKAIERAETDEEKENAARLREVVRNTKVNTVYTEEGYEDSAYDHAGHTRDADYQEGYARKLREQLNLRKKTDDEKDVDEESESGKEGYATIDPEEFKEYEDYDGGYEDHRADTNLVSKGRKWKVVDPKTVAVNGIKRLQDDLEKEAEEAEKGAEIGEPNGYGGSTSGESSRENSVQSEKIKKRRRPSRLRNSRINDKERSEESRAIQNVENRTSTIAPYQTTTLRNNLENLADTTMTRKPENRENLPYTGSIDFQPVQENPTTVSYSQLFWDYFKTRQIEPTTIEPAILLDPATMSPNVGSVNTLSPYFIREDDSTTPYPLVDLAVFGAKTLATTQIPIDSGSAKNSEQSDQVSRLKDINGNGEFWQPVNLKEPPTTTDIRLLGSHNDDQGTLFANFVTSLDGNAESSGNFDGSPFNPSLNQLASRKPRYKIAVRHKPTERPVHESSTSGPANEARVTGIPLRSVPWNENYMKVLNHLKNQQLKAKNPSPPNGLQSQGYYSTAERIDPRDLTIMRPPLPQKTSDVAYYNFLPRKRVEKATIRSQKSRQARTNPGKTHRYPDSPRVVQRALSSRNRNSLPVQRSDLPPMGPFPGETIYYATENNDSNRARALIGAFRGTVAGIRARSRDRRSTNEQNEGSTNDWRALANDHGSNRSDTGRTTNGTWIERDSRSNGTGEVQLALVPDTSKIAEKRGDEKKSRSDRIEPGGGSRSDGPARERESGADVQEAIGGDSKLAKRDDDESREKASVDEEEAKENVESSGNHEDLLNESPRVTNDVIQKEIDARFHGDEKDDKGGDTEGKGEDEVEVEVEVPDFDYVEELPEEKRADEDTAKATLDSNKYPFYNHERIPTPSALRYAVDPKTLPKKTYGGMEFYASRDEYKHCDEVEPNLKVLPEKEEPVADRGPEENLPRLRGLGDKLDCFKAKYFDNDPFDNPLFLEEEVEQPSLPAELDTKRFAARIMVLPEQNDDYVIQKLSRRPENYRQSRKQNSNAGRPKNSRPVRYRAYAGAGGGKRPRVYRVQGSQGSPVKYSKSAGRQQNVARRPVTSASDVWSTYTPYQRQVYEDVMGTIRNMANSYQVREVTTVATIDEATVVDDTVDDLHTNVSAIEKGKKDNASSTSIKDPGPGRAKANIEGLTPPRYRARYRSGYKRSRLPQTTVARMQLLRKPSTVLRVSRRQKLRVYKRELRGRDSDEESRTRSVESISVMEDTNRKEPPSRLEKNNNGSMFNHSSSRIDSTIRNVTDFPDTRNSTTVNIVPQAADANRRFKVQKSGSGDVPMDGVEEKKEKSGKVVYTIKDRIRYSKPKDETRRIGKFVNETQTQEDRRRKEPKYNYIKRRRPSSRTSSATKTPSSETSDEVNWTVPSVATATITNVNVDQPDVEHEKDEKPNHFPVADIDQQHSNESKRLERQDQIAGSNVQQASSNATGNGYEVREVVNENEVTTTQKPSLTSSSEFHNLRSFLEDDPPGYTGLSTEDFKESLASKDNDTNEFKLDPESTNAKETENVKQEEDDASSFRELSNENSSEKLGTSSELGSSTESSEEIEDSKENESRERSTFFRYETRPSSPAENYEDERYSDLGPRVNKPAFFHPPFSYAGRSMSGESSEEQVEESDEMRERYVFPWHRDKLDERRKRRRRNRGKSIGEYEYPWERRERLEREEKRLRDEKRKGLTMSFDDDEEEETGHASFRRRRTYPRGRYRFWDGSDRYKWDESDPDNAESSSEHRPVTKYSSRYRAKNGKLPIGKKSTNIGSSNAEEISKSIEKVLEDDFDETSRSNEKKKRKKNGSLHGTRGVAGGIVPEHVTLEPTRRNQKKMKEVVAAEAMIIESKRSNESTKNDTFETELRTTTARTIGREVGNFTERSSKKRRRPAKNTATTVVTPSRSTEKSNRTRRRPKSGSTTPATITTTASTSSTTTASRVIRRRNHKSVKDSRRLGAAKVADRTNNRVGKVTATKSSSLGQRSGTVKGKIEDKKGSTNEIALDRPEEKTRARLTLREQSNNVKLLEKDRGNRMENENVNRGSDAGDTLIKIKETNQSSDKYPSMTSDEKFDFKDDRIEILSDFDKSDDSSDDDDDDDDDDDLDKEFDSVLKTDVSFIPQNRAVQLSEQGSREVVSSVSWISENYNF